MIKMRVYVISLMAFAPLLDTTVQGESTLVEHIGAIVPAESMEAAAESAKQHAFQRWKVDEGWHSHQAAVMPVPKSFYDAFFSAVKAGVADLTDVGEQEKVFQFDKSR